MKRTTGIPDIWIYGTALLSVAALVVFVFYFMQEPNESGSKPKAEVGTHEIVRLPEELSADFKYGGGWWTANGPAGDDAVRRLAKKHSTLPAICLNQAGITSKGFDYLYGHHLRSLDLINLDINVEMANSISHLESLQELLLKDAMVSDQVLKALTGPPTLESLLLKNSTASKVGFAGFHSRFPKLKALSLINCKNIDDSIVSELVHCSNLESLNVITTPISADAMLLLSNKLPLKCISFEYQKDASRFIERLNCSTLSELHLNGSVLNESSFSSLGKFTQLKRLVLIDCQNLSKDQITELVTKLPKCNVRGGQNEAAPELGLVE